MAMEKQLKRIYKQIHHQKSLAGDQEMKDRELQVGYVLIQRG